MFRGLEGLNSFEQAAIWVVLALAVAGLGYAAWLRSQILAYETGTERMREVWGWIRAGANAAVLKYRVIVRSPEGSDTAPPR